MNTPHQSLFDAAAAISLDYHGPGIAELVAQGADPNEQGHIGQTPLHVAAGWNDAGAIAELIAGGSDPDAGDQHGDTPLHLAAEDGMPDALAALIELGADLEARNHWGQTPLHMAGEAGWPEEVAILTKAGADVNARSRFGTAPLHDAVHPDMITTLIGAGADLEARDLFDDTALHKAASAADPEAARILIEAGADVNARNEFPGNTPLHAAIRAIELQPDVDPDDLAVDLAACVTTLTLAGADPNIQDEHGRTPMQLAAHINNTVAAGLLQASSQQVSKSTQPMPDSPSAPSM